MDSKPHNEPVPLAFARALLLEGQQCGVAIDAMLASAGFPFNPMDPPAEPCFVSTEQYSRLCNALFRELGDESGGVMRGSPTPAGTTRLLLYCLINCKSLQAVLDRAIEFNACCREAGNVQGKAWLEIDENLNLASLHYSRMSAADGDPGGGDLCALSMWLRLCGWLIGQHIDVQAACCPGDGPDSMLALRHFLHCPVRFGADSASLSFSARHLEAPVTRCERELRQFLPVAPYHVVIKPAASDNSVSERIRALLGEDVREELPGFDTLASMLNMSARTLRRRLEKEGTSYQRIKDNLRRDAAISLLSRSRMSVSDVADRVGFSDSSAFHRSFKKWTGLSPGEYR